MTDETPQHDELEIPEDAVEDLAPDAEAGDVSGGGGVVNSPLKLPADSQWK